MVSETQLKRVCGYLEAGKKEGAGQLLAAKRAKAPDISSSRRCS